jgi:SH3-like domain-containing protein
MHKITLYALGNLPSARRKCLLLRRLITHRPARRLLAVALLLMLPACGLNAQTFPTQIVSVPTVPTNTLAPLLTMTPRFTATPIPTSTMIPTNTLAPTETPLIPTETLTPTPAPTTAVRGAVNNRNASVRLRAGPGTDYEPLRTVPSGALLIVIGISSDQLWYNVILEDGTEGWMLGELVTVPERTAVPIFATAELTARAALPRSTLTFPTSVPTLRARANTRTDVLAYCDLPGFRSEANKVFGANERISVYWTWFARTAEQIQDHLDAGFYEVQLERKEGETWQLVRKLEDYTNFRTATVRLSATRQEVRWFVPIGTLESGEYRVSYRLTWSRRIEDGDKSFGPGGDEEINTGTCLFRVR